VDQPVKFAAQVRGFLREHVWVALVIGLVLLGLQDVFGTHGVLAMHRSQKEAEQIRNEIKQLDDENRQLQDHVKDLKSDPAEIERIAREDMGLARPGEYIFKLPPKNETVTSNPRNSAVDQSK
jgi:cell division protein FtsB